MDKELIDSGEIFSTYFEGFKVELNFLLQLVLNIFFYHNSTVLELIPTISHNNSKGKL